MAGIIFGCIILILVGWAIVKGKYAPFILIASGVAMLAFSVFFDTGTFMPKKALPTGNDYLNIIEFIRYMFSTRLAGLGLLIMTMVGFASYMTHIGANDAFVNIAIKPLSIIKSPYALVFLAFLLGKAVSMVITSAVGLGACSPRHEQEGNRCGFCHLRCGFTRAHRRLNCGCSEGLLPLDS